MRTAQKSELDHDVKHIGSQNTTASKSAASPQAEALDSPYCTGTRTATDRGSCGGEGEVVLEEAGADRSPSVMGFFFPFTKVGSSPAFVDLRPTNLGDTHALQMNLCFGQSRTVGSDSNNIENTTRKSQRETTEDNESDAKHGREEKNINTSAYHVFHTFTIDFDINQMCT